MGFRESVSIQEVIDQIKMESTEEKAYLALIKQQEEEAKEASKKLMEKKWKYKEYMIFIPQYYLFDILNISIFI